MELSVISHFELNPQGELCNIQRVVHEYTTNLQLQEIITVRCIYVKCGKILFHHQDFFLKNLFVDKQLYYVNDGSNSSYLYIYGDETKLSILRATNATCKPTSYPYKLIPQNYTAAVQPIRFHLPMEAISSNIINRQLKYTFGIEFETAGGVIPEDKCFSLGLIPLRDGSISGIEYATIPMSYRNLNLLKAQVQCLKQYTTTNDTCSMHMHFGKLPCDLRFYYVLYRIFNQVEFQIDQFMPEYTFHTEQYKRNGKNYCCHLPLNFNLFDFYEWISSGVQLDSSATRVNLRTPHRNDRDGTRKWNILQRYYSLNLINALFYNKNKTVEFRFLKPSYNINFIINWLYLFTAILKTAEIFYTVNELKDKTFDECNQLCCNYFRHNNIDLNTCINTAFTHVPTKDILMRFLNNMATVTKLQYFLNDKIGLKTQFHDIYFKENPIGQ